MSEDELRRTLAETRAQLEKAEKLAAIGQLVVGVAHEINNPLNLVAGNVEFLKRYVAQLLRLLEAYSEVGLSPQDGQRIAHVKRTIDFDFLVADTRKVLEAMTSGAARATSILGDLRAVMQGGGPGTRAPVDLAHCLEDTLSLVAHDARGRVTFTRHFAPDVPKVSANEGQLGQVFLNLILNAMQAGAKNITLTLSQRDGGVGIDVADDGSGIADPEKLFTAFYSTKPKGTGLGLSISRTLIQAHEGRLTAASNGKGSTFSVWLPV